MTRFILLFQVAVIVFAGPLAVWASPADDAAVLAGYRKLYAGDLDTAKQEFDRILAAEAGGLPARFGILHVLERRLRDTRSVAPEFERLIDRFIADADARLSRSDRDAEALFYLASAYMLRAQYRFDYDKGMWGAARDGARSKKLSEQYIRWHPEHGDAYFALGVYNYYVELAPAFAKVMRFIMFLPAGNRAEGLKQIERAYREGSLFAPQAGLLLTEIYGTFESRPADGIRVGERLAADYPDNPRYQFTLAELYGSPAVEDPARAEERYRAVIAAEERRAGPPRPARYQAQLGAASSLFEQWRVDDAIGLLTATIDRPPASPAWVAPGFLLRRANYRALSGDMRGAHDDVVRVLGQPAWKDRHKAATDLGGWMDRLEQSGDGAVYAALVPANRLAFERRWAEAAASYDIVRARYPTDPQVRFRIAQMRLRQGDITGLADEFAAVSDAKNSPSWLKAAALLNVGRVHDLEGHRADARNAYQRVVDSYEKESSAWPARVGLVTAYQRR